jgi:hypothetical protein
MDPARPILLVRLPAAGAVGELRTGLLHRVTILPREQKSESSVDPALR